MENKKQKHRKLQRFWKARANPYLIWSIAGHPNLQKQTFLYLACHEQSMGIEWPSGVFWGGNNYEKPEMKYVNDETKSFQENIPGLLIAL